MSFLYASKFYISRFYLAQKLLFICLTFSTFIGLALAGATLSVRGQQISLAQERTQLMQPRPRELEAVTTSNPTVSLPSLAAGDIVKRFNGIAVDMHVPLDEVVYVLDSQPNVPYRRYRITLTTKAAYPDIRKFVAVLSGEMPYVSLDSIRCARPDAAAPTLGCELALSAFFSKPNDG